MCASTLAERCCLLVARQVALVAESFGGALALRVAAAAPQLLSRLVVVRAALARLSQKCTDCHLQLVVCHLMLVVLMLGVLTLGV